MANQDSSKGYYSYSKLEKFRRCERNFRSVQAVLLLLMIIVFIFYMITFGIDIAKFLNDPPLLAASLCIVIVAMIFLVIGIRGVAFESFCKVLSFAIVFFLVTIAHGVTFLYRHPGLTATNLVLALILFIGAVIYLCYLCRMNRLKPPDYGKTTTTTVTADDDDDAESRIALNDPKIVKKGFTDLNQGLTEPAKREMSNVKAGFDGEEEAVKKEYSNLQSSPNEADEKEFVSVKRVLLNEAQNLRDNVEREYDNLKAGLSDNKREIGETIHREYKVVKREITGNIDRLSDDMKGRYSDLENELRGSFKSNLGDIEKEFNIFQREFPETANIDNDSGDSSVQRMLTSVRKGFEEFKSGGENVKREIVEVKRDESGNITSYIERRFTDSGVEICSVSVDKNRAPIANFTNS